MGDNPFLSLFSSNQSIANVRKCAEDVFDITDDSSKPGFSELFDSKDINSLEHALFERLIAMTDQNSGPKPVPYLFSAYFKSKPYKNTSEYSVIAELILRNLSTAFIEPHIYQSSEDSQEIYRQFLEILQNQDLNEEDVKCLVIDLIGKFESEGENMKTDLLIPTLRLIYQEIKNDDTFTGVSGHLLSIPAIRSLRYFVIHPTISEAFIDFNTPENSTIGALYSDTILGRMISRSCLPSKEVSPFQYFDSPSSLGPGAHAQTETRIWTGLQSIHDILHDIFKSLLKQTSVNQHTLKWIGDCIHKNSGRGNLWTSETLALSTSFVSDGFMLNLGSILLKLCHPFTNGIMNKKMLKINLNYTGESSADKVHCKDIHTMSTLVPKEESTRSSSDTSFNFITEIFFLTHKALDLGFRVAQEKLVKLSRELSQLQDLYRSTGGSGEAPETILSRMDKLSQKYFCYKTALLENRTLEYFIQFVSATSSWLVHSAASNPPENDFAVFPLTSPTSMEKLCLIPEFVVENIYEFLLLVKRFSPQSFEDHGEYLPPLMDFILAFMGSQDRLRNPHLRARLAESLHCLLPIHELENQTTSFLRKFSREALFSTYPNRLEIVPSLLNVFINIETTGQSVQFEQKFAYRRPMYEVINYLWEFEEFKNKFLSLADEAEAHMEDEEPPIFLKFVNLLVNDAIFLLDEALGFMKQIQELQSQRESWKNLPPLERSEKESEYQHMGRMAKYHNLMGSDTINMLNRLSGVIKSVFTHPTMVDRIAAMLNYFLKTLVGPERKSFKVDDLDSYEFKPGVVVTVISKIYINFQSSKTFCLAVSSDGRSYYEELFEQAGAVLNKIGEYDVEEALLNIEVKVKSTKKESLREEELFSDPPDEFLDPIMSVLMKDPVTLPDSGITVDRHTIARHLLSDQTDPFNRMPLSMDKIKSNSELKKRIEDWMDEQRKKL